MSDIEALRRHPVKVIEHYGADAESAVARFNARLAVFITRRIGTMWTAYVFASVTVLGFPGLLGDNALKYVLWGSTIFLQLVLLPIIIVGQNVQASAADARAAATYTDTEAILAEIRALAPALQ